MHQLLLIHVLLPVILAAPLPEPLQAPTIIIPPPITMATHISLPPPTRYVIPVIPSKPKVYDPNPSGLVWVSMYWLPQPTASGRKFRPYSEHTAAHLTLPFFTRVLIEYPPTGRRVWVEITDRGPYVHPRKLDLTPHTYNALHIPPGDIVRVRVLAIQLP